MYVFATPLESLVCIYVYMICNMYEIYLWWCIHKSKKVPKYMQAWTISGWMDGSFGNKVAEFVLARQFRLRAGVEARNNIVNQAGSWEELSKLLRWFFLQNFEGLPQLAIFCKSVTQSFESDKTMKPANGMPGFLLMFAPCAPVLDPDVHVASDGLECWLGSLVFFRESRELGRQKCLGLSCWNAKKKPRFWQHSVVFFSYNKFLQRIKHVPNVR